VRSAIYPGTFDPITNGHLDLIRRGLRLFDRVVVAVGTAQDKDPMFTASQRVELISGAVSDLDGVSVISFEGLLVNTVRDVGAAAILRGLREVSDFEYEFQMALMNRRLAAEIETVFLMPSERYTYLNSTIVKEVFTLGGDVSGLVPPNVFDELARRRGGAGGA
jgi:pantetheine-phosphate adenylyltransferase